MIIRSLLAAPPYLAMLYFAELSIGVSVIPASGELCDVLAGYFAVSTLLGYNNYRGREGDAVSPKAARRPLAGLKAAHPGAEAVVATTAFLAVALPLLRGSLVAAFLFAASLWTYAALFANRSSARPSPFLKPLSATLGTALLMAGMVYPEASLRPELAINAVCTVVLTTLWRFAFELTCDATDYEADLVRGEVTPATSWGLRAALITAPASLLPCVVVMASFVLSYERAWPVALLACVSSAVVLATAMVAAWFDTGLRTRLLVRFSTMFTFAAGIALLLWVADARAAAVLWFVFMLAAADLTAVVRLLRPAGDRPMPGAAR